MKKKVIGRYVENKSLTLSIITKGRFESGKLGRAGLNSRIQNELGHLYEVLFFFWIFCLFACVLFCLFVFKYKKKKMVNVPQNPCFHE